jgi:hypothetical protein
MGKETPYETQFQINIINSSAIVAVGALMGAGQLHVLLHAADAADSDSGQQHIQRHKQGPLVLPLLMVLLALPGAMGSSLLAQRRQQPL